MAATLARAEIIAVGSELLTPFRLDTNSLAVTERLNDIGIEVRRKTIVGDDRQELRAALSGALERVDLIVVTGGLGPTEDDVTRDVVAEALDLPLEEDAGILDSIRQRFAVRGLRMPEINRRQAMVPHGARPLQNPTGTAPGLWIELDAQVVLLLPGPPRELQPMLDQVVPGRLAERAGGRRLYRRVLRVALRSESHVEELAQPVYSRWERRQPPIATTILAAPGQIELHLSVVAAGAAEAQAALEAAARELREAIGPDVFTLDGRLLEEVAGELLRRRGLMVAVGESCTGGLVASRLTDVPGSSDYVQLGVVSYSNQAKIDLLEVPARLIEEHGAVSEPVARALAEGARARGRADVGIGVTGIAGPGGGTERKPVGTVSVAVIGPEGLSRVRTFLFPGNRAQVKFQAAQAALDLMRRMLEDGGRAARAAEPVPRPGRAS